MTNDSFVWVIMLMLFIPVNNGSVMSGRFSFWVEPELSRGYGVLLKDSTSAFGDSRTSDPSILSLLLYH